MNNYYNIEDPNIIQANCSPILKQSGSDLPEANIISILSISDGYTKHDKIVQIGLDVSLKQDGFYDIGVGSKINIDNVCNDKLESFEISNISDVSNITIISLYSKESTFNSFFKNDYKIGNIDCYKLLSDNSVENLQNGCISPKFNLKNITSNSFVVSILNEVESNNFYIRYYSENSNSKVVFNNTYSEIKISNLSTDTKYYVSVCKECSGEFSFYSDYDMVKTL